MFIATRLFSTISTFPTDPTTTTTSQMSIEKKVSKSLLRFIHQGLKRDIDPSYHLISMYVSLSLSILLRCAT